MGISSVPKDGLVYTHLNNWVISFQNIILFSCIVTYNWMNSMKIFLLRKKYENWVNIISLVWKLTGPFIKPKLNNNVVKFLACNSSDWKSFCLPRAVSCCPGDGAYAFVKPSLSQIQVYWLLWHMIYIPSVWLNPFTCISCQLSVLMLNLII